MQNRIAHRQERERRLVSFARKHLGKPYKYGARPWQAPRFFDCSSFVQYCFRRIGIDLPRVSIDQARLGERVDERALRKVGDLVFFRGTMGRYNPKFPKGVGHVAIYTGKGKVIHAAPPGGVVEEPLARARASRKPITAIRRFF
ncbi:MAG: C40 family peptidase [Candidatus Terrybacteria bacterium]|nr:C40 family peptidase [Candidatus Terrybacteria bacterium]